MFYGRMITIETKFDYKERQGGYLLLFAQIHRTRK